MLNSISTTEVITGLNKIRTRIILSSFLTLLFLIINVFGYAGLNGPKPVLATAVKGTGQSGIFSPDALRYKGNKVKKRISLNVSSYIARDRTLALRPSQSFRHLHKSPLRKNNHGQWPFTSTAAISPNRREILSGERHASGEKESAQDH
ncbi:MAG: hypothetical protein HQK83_05155 [Fibrobacteria bacterium]|nr:hypothetical protein [Fibrobacteria bacterium]